MKFTEVLTHPILYGQSKILYLIRRTTLDELNKAVLANFEGYEEVRKDCLGLRQIWKRLRYCR